MKIRKLEEPEIPAAMELVWRVFQEFEAPAYPPEGIETFRRFITDRSESRRLLVYGAFEEGTLTGVLALRSGGTHVSLFFVEAARHRQGIGKALFRYAPRDTGPQTLTVHAAPYAVEIYRHLGFRATGQTRQEDGILYIPMRWEAGR